MRKLIFGVAVVAASMTAMPSSAVAQAAMPIGFGAVIGASMPLGSWGDYYKTGWHAGGLVTLSPASIPFGLRVDGVYHSMGGKEEFDEDATWSVFNVNLNGVWNIPMTGSPIQPYIIGGVGIYSWKESFHEGGIEYESDRENDLGLNAGGGIRFMLSGFNAFVEARWHHIMVEDDAAHMIPISFGITIR